MHDSTDTSDIRAEISQTRGRLSDTLNELGERLNPQHVKQQVTNHIKDGIRDATIGRVEHMARSAADSVSATGNGIGATVRDNPIPAAMVAIGLAWMLFNGKRGERGDGYAVANRPSHAAGDARDRLTNAAASVTDSVKDGAERLADRGRDLYANVGDHADGLASSVSQRAQGVSRSVASTATRSARRIEDSFYDNPLAIGAVAMAVGVMAGLAAPTTDREVELMGDARERVGDRARDVVHEARDKAKHVAERVVDEAKRAIKDESAPHNSEPSQTVGV